MERMRAPDGGFYITIRRGEKLIRADYAGGPYIELTFGSEGYHPTEVINVWDYDNNKPEIVLDGGSKANRDAVRAEVLNWMEATAEEWPEWYAGYLENARY